MSRAKENKKVLIMAGGTGGHVFPALSIARVLEENALSVEWLGTRNGLEAKLIGDSDIPLHFIPVEGLRGKGVLKKLMSPVTVAWAILQAVVKLSRIKPHCVLGMGGFASGPGGVAAWLLRKPLLIHEQNAVAGFTNQALFPLARLAMEAFPGAYARKKILGKNKLLQSLVHEERALSVGNPVRKEISSCPGPEERFAGRAGPLKLLVLGGSLGAVAINKAIPALLAALDEDRRPEVLHQVGEKNLTQTLGFYGEHNIPVNKQVRVEGFIKDMAEAYCWADLVICRAGAITVSELASVGLASILIPFPYAVDDHQTENARFLQEHGAAYLIKQSELSVTKLKEIMTEFVENRSKLLEFAQAARSVAVPDAAEIVAQKCIEACYA